ncbi:MAG: hypothetical protein MZV70_34860 [Desulfobacterales bacterium]|nr:hypothetical protein [Desulfobacterales bacterium]
MRQQAGEDFESALKTFKPPFDPRFVFLFSGHMIDHAGTRPAPLSGGQGAARGQGHRRNARSTGRRSRRPGASAAAPAAATPCSPRPASHRGLRLQLHIQFQEPEFLKASVSFAGVRWVERYDQLRAHDNTTLLVMPEELGRNCRRARTPTSATTCGSSIPPFPTDPRRCASSACGTAKAATGPAARSTC